MAILDTLAYYLMYLVHKECETQFCNVYPDKKTFPQLHLTPENTTSISVKSLERTIHKHITRNTCIAEPREARGEAHKGWEDRREMK